MSSSCFKCDRRGKPCCCGGVLKLFGRRGPRAAPSRQVEEEEEKRTRPTLLRRALGGMRNGRRRRRHRASSFSSVRAVFWPLMSMGSDVDRTDVAVDRPRSSSADSGSAVRAPSPSLDTPSASATAARVLALQAASPAKPTGTACSITTSVCSPSPPPYTPAASTTAARVLALQARLSAAAALAPPSKAGGLRGIAAACDDGDVEDACRGFERSLAELLIEEGKVGDLMDVEELLCCWEKLRSPVFVRLVCRFYGELCMDLFSDESSHDSNL